MYKAILVPLDGSKRAETILPHIESMALRYSAKIVFLQIISPVGEYQTLLAPDYRYKEAFEQHNKEAESFFIIKPDSGYLAQLDLLNNTIGCAAVGCSILSYNYFNVDMIAFEY